MLVARGASPAPAMIPSTPRVFADGRDHYTLLDRHLVNRQLSLQLDDDDQAFRLGRDWDRLALAADLAIGAQQTPDDSRQSRYHGYFLANTYGAVRVLDGLDANLNLLLFNPSASDGYRRSSQIDAGLGLHAHFDLFAIAGKPLRADLLGTDLDWVTLGTGLLIEQTPLEGVRGALSYEGWMVDWMYAGRALWSDDDLITTTASAFDGLAKILFVQWQRSGPRQPDPVTPLSPSPDAWAKRTVSYYLSGSVDVPLMDHFRIATEYAARLRRPLRHGWLARADAMGSLPDWLAVHAGYQFRWYQDGFGPRDALFSPTTTFNVPYREDTYVTNSFEYFGISEFFEQWSHTAMLEGRARLSPHLGVFAEGEFWLRYAAARSEPKVVVYTPAGFRAPSRDLSVYYRAGFSLFPWPDLPHRGNCFLTNKQTDSDTSAADPIVRRYDPGTYVVFELEAWL
jgi:hypothetical protein